MVDFTGQNAYEYVSPAGLPGSVMAEPYQYTPLSPGQHNVALTTVQSLTVPVGALYATVIISGAAARYTLDGVTVPTTVLGNPVAAGGTITLSGPATLANFKVIGTGATLDVEYFK